MYHDGSVTETRKDDAVPQPDEDRLTEQPETSDPLTSDEKAAPPSARKAGQPSSHGKKKGLAREVREFIIRVAATLVIVWLTLTFLFGIYMSHSDACSPMVKDGDLCITWRPAVPSQGDVIVYRHNGATGFGRVAAVSGDRVEIRDGVVWVNGYVAAQELQNSTLPGADAGEFPLTVPENSVFVLNDNLSDVNDSRTYGAIPIDECCGSVVFLMRRRGF